jgi:hypothetical protein
MLALPTLRIQKKQMMAYDFKLLWLEVILHAATDIQNNLHLFFSASHS